MHGQIIGTPAYMAPEQAMGMVDQIAPQTDVYGLGALLYHLLTLAPVHTGKSNREVVRKVLNDPIMPMQEREYGREVPPEVAALCMRCLAREPQDRFADASALHEAIQDYLDGQLDQRQTGGEKEPLSPRPLSPPPRPKGSVDRNRLEARRLELDQLLSHYQNTQEDLAGLEDTRATASLRGEIELKADAERRLASLQLLKERQFVQMSTLLQRQIDQIREHEGEESRTPSSLSELHEEARELQLSLQLSRYEQALIGGTVSEQATAMLALERLDPQLREQLEGQIGSLYLSVRPATAKIQLWRTQSEGAVLTKSRARALRTTPLLLERIPAGRYLISAEHEAGSPLEISLQIDPGLTTRLSLQLYQADKHPAGFCYIPGGSCRSGSPDSHGPPAEERALAEFMLAQYPVTAAEYLDFLYTLTPAERKRHQPRVADTPLWRWESGQLFIPDGEGTGGWSAQSPVVGISFRDALAYCAWRSDRDKRRYRLPSDVEWEKGARGAEGRSFPWGEVWDPTLALGPEQWSHSCPPPIGLAPHDRSVYGVHDLVGGVREWTVDSDEQGHPSICGGSFRSDEHGGRRLWRRAAIPAAGLADDIGFRLALDTRAEDRLTS